MKKKIFGMPLAVLLIGILVVGMGTAALVNFLSNSVEIKAEVKSPLQLSMWHWNGSGEVVSQTLPSFYGGETIYTNIIERNLANVPIDSTLRIIFDDGNDNVCAEIEFLGFRDEDATTNDLAFTEITGNCVVDANGNLRFDIPQTLSVGHAETYQVKITMSPYAVGTYTVTVQHI